MNIKEIKIALAQQAQSKGICQEWLAQLREVTSYEALMEMYLKGIDFCISKNFPDNAFIREHFKGKMEKYGVYLDDEVQLTNPKKCVLLGDANAELKFADYSTGEVFINHISQAKIRATGNAFVMVDVFDKSKVHVIAEDDAKVCVNEYKGAETTFRTEGNARVKIIKKNKQTY